VIASELLAQAMGFNGNGPLNSAVSPNRPEELIEWVRSGGLNEQLTSLARVLADADDTEWRAWKRTLFDARSPDPVFLASVFDLAEGPFHVVPPSGA
jgi:hypothetical protein